MKMAKSFSSWAKANLLCIAMLTQPWVWAQNKVTITAETDSVVVKTATDVLRITVCGPTVVHVVASPDGQSSNATPQQLWMVKRCTPSKFTLNRSAPAATTLDTGSIKVSISSELGNLLFNDGQGQRLLK